MEGFAGKVFAVTGGTGFLGGEVVPRLLERGARVRLIVRRKTSHTPDSVDVVVAGLGDEGALTDAFRGCEGVFHLAGLVIHSRSHGKEGIEDAQTERRIAFRPSHFCCSRTVGNQRGGYNECRSSSARCRLSTSGLRFIFGSRWLFH